MNDFKTEDRIIKLKEEVFKSFDASGILIFKDEDIFYLSGFYGKSSGCVLLITDKKNYLFVNFIYLEEAGKTATKNGFEIVRYAVEKNIVISETLKAQKINTVLMQSDFISYSHYIKLEAEFNEINIKVINVDNPLKDLRLIKDNSEQNLIREACRLTDKSFDNICNLTYKDIINKKDSSLGLEIEKFLVDSGGGRKSFDYVIANNDNSSKPHYEPGNNKINDGILLMDFGVIFKNYCSDITRTIFIGGKINSELKKIYEIVREAQLMAVDFCTEGIRACELDNIARKYITDMGYGDNFGHSLGHGIGLNVHEPPWINTQNDQILKEGMVITIEPGIYIKNLGGIRIEDMVIVKKIGCENLYKSSKKAIQIY